MEREAPNEKTAGSSASFSKHRPLPEAERKSLEPPNSSERKRRYYLPESLHGGDRMRNRGSFDRYDRYRYHVAPTSNLSNQSIRESVARNNKTEFSPFQPRNIQINNSGELGKENSLKHANHHQEGANRAKREQTTTFSPYEERLKQYRYDNLRRQEVAAVLPFHFNEERKLADSLGNLRQRISKELSFKQPRHYEHPLPVPLMHPPPHVVHEIPQPLPPARMFGGSPRETSKDIIIEELTQSNQYLNEQIIQYKQIVHRLESQLRSKESKMLLCTENVERRVLEERLNNDKIVAEMRNEIKLLLEKNELLGRRFEQQQQETQLRERRSQTYYVSGRKQPVAEEDSRIIDELTQLINREYFQKVAKDKLPGHIKSSSKELRPLISQILKRNVKLESFANCVIDMRSKIVGGSENDLKKCWKWLKQLVEEAYRVKKLYEGEIRQRLHLKEGSSSEEICQAVLRKL